MHPSLRTFLDLLNRENEIITIKAEVDPYLELAEIHRRVISEGGPALMFERVKGSRYPVVTNMFGTERRIDLAFGPAGTVRARYGSHPGVDPAAEG
jgi:UbiD family decarboxylase